MGAILAFLYGTLGGVAFVVLFFIYAFRNAQKLLQFMGDRFFDRNRRKRGMKMHMQNDDTYLFGDEDDEDELTNEGDDDDHSRSATHVSQSTGDGMYHSPTKRHVESATSAASGYGLPDVLSSPGEIVKKSAHCAIATFEGDYIASPHNCRISLVGGAVSVYQSLSSRFRGNEQNITTEHLKGTILLENLKAEMMVLQPHVVLPNGTKIANPLHGKLLVLRSTTGPLFSQTGGTSSTVFPGRNNRNTNSKTRSRVDTTAATPPRNGDETAAAENVPPAHRPMREWRVMLIKFPLARETERWMTLLQPTDLTYHWRAYMRSLPLHSTFNFVLARLALELNRADGLRSFLEEKIQKKLHKVRRKFPREIKGGILLDRLDYGNEVPIFSNVTNPLVSENGEFAFGFDVLFRGGVKLHFRLDLTYRGIRIPHVVFVVEILFVRGTGFVSIGPPPTKKLWLGARYPPEVRLKFSPGVASGKGLLHSILTSLPDLSEIFTNLIKIYLFGDLVLPNLDDFTLPNVEKTPPSTRRNSVVENLQNELALAYPEAEDLLGSNGNHSAAAVGPGELPSVSEPNHPDESSPLNTTNVSVPRLPIGSMEEYTPLDGLPPSKTRSSTASGSATGSGRSSKVARGSETPRSKTKRTTVPKTRKSTDMLDSSPTQAGPPASATNSDFKFPPLKEGADPNSERLVFQSAGGVWVATPSQRSAQSTARTTSGASPPQSASHRISVATTGEGGVAPSASGRSASTSVKSSALRNILKEKAKSMQKVVAKRVKHMPPSAAE